MSVRDIERVDKTHSHGQRPRTAGISDSVSDMLDIFDEICRREHDRMPDQEADHDS